MTPIERAKIKQDARDILGVGAHASETELRAAWKRRAFEVHPDRHAGDDRAFQEVRMAYEYLSGETDVPPEKPEHPGTAPAPAPSARAMRRAAIKTRLVELGALASELGAADPASPDVADHIPAAMRRKGRAVTYIIEGELSEGTNRITIPLPKSGKAKGPRSTVVSFSSPRAGAGKIEVPDSIRESSFPDARRVRLQFSPEGERHRGEG
jgi:hypothetical protein